MRYFLFAIALVGFVIAIYQRIPGIMPAGVGCILLALWPHQIRTPHAPKMPDSRPVASRPVERGTERKSA